MKLTTKRLTGEGLRLHFPLFFVIYAILGQAVVAKDSKDENLQTITEKTINETKSDLNVNITGQDNVFQRRSDNGFDLLNYFVNNINHYQQGQQQGQQEQQQAQPSTQQRVISLGQLLGLQPHAQQQQQPLQGQQSYQLQQQPATQYLERPQQSQQATQYLQHSQQPQQQEQYLQHSQQPQQQEQYRQVQQQPQQYTQYQQQQPTQQQISQQVQYIQQQQNQPAQQQIPQQSQYRQQPQSQHHQEQKTQQIQYQHQLPVVNSNVGNTQTNDNNKAYYQDLLQQQQQEQSQVSQRDGVYGASNFGGLEPSYHAPSPNAIGINIGVGPGKPIAPVLPISKIFTLLPKIFNVLSGGGKVMFGAELGKNFYFGPVGAKPLY